MSAQLTDKVIVITGGTRGLGLAIAQQCVAAGAKVIVTSRTATAVESAVTLLQGSGRRAAGIPCDVANAGEVAAVKTFALDTFGRLDVWFNNAGVSAPYGPTIAIPPADFLRVIQTNIVGVYHGAYVALQHFIAQRSGKLINIYGAGDKRVRPFQNAYGSSKNWVRAFTRTLAKEYKDAGIEIIGFNPGLVITDMLSDVETAPGYEAAVQPLATVVRLWGNPPEVPAMRAVWLASAATNGRNGLEVQQLTAPVMAAGLLKEGWRRIARRPQPEFTLNIRTVSSA